MSGVDLFNRKIRQVEGQNTILQHMGNPADLMGAGGTERGPRSDFRPVRKTLSPSYTNAFYAMVRSAGKGPQDASLTEGFDPAGGGYALPGFAPRIGATTYEGSPRRGGYAVPISVDDQIVPLAPQEMALAARTALFPPRGHQATR